MKDKSAKNVEKKKMTREDKKKDLRARIVSSAFALFMEQGYDATTIRQILESADVLNGSLYNIFKGKEEIYSAILTKALTESVAESRKYMGDEDDVSNATFPLILVLYASYKSEKLANLISVIDTKWKLKSDMVEVVMNWIESYFGKLDMTDEDKRIKVIACIGVIGSMVEAFKENVECDFKDTVGMVTTMFYSAFDVDLNGMTERNEKIISIIENNDITVCGLHI